MAHSKVPKHGCEVRVDALSNKGCLLECVGTRDSMAMSLLIDKGRGDAALQYCPYPQKLHMVW